MATITQVHAREILDSRGNPTVEADVVLDGGRRGRAAVPSGASTGAHEAIELRDGDPARYGGKGVLQAVAHVNGEIDAALKGLDPVDQEHIDRRLIEIDGTPDKARLGANAILAASLAVAKAGAAARGLPLYRHLDTGRGFSMPVPQMNILNGGAHADNSVDLQEFMVLPVAAERFRDALRWGAEVFQSLKAVLAQRGLSTSVGDEGGFAPDLDSNAAAFDMVIDAVQRSGFEPGRDVYLGLDAASSELYRDGNYHLTSEGRKLSAARIVDLLETWLDDYPIVSIEDGMAEDDWDGWQRLTERIGQRVQLTGDDLFVTSTELLNQGIERNVANAILIKVNQVGTLSETLQAVRMAQDAGYGVTISHRSGETEDTFIADLAVATGAGQIKTGSLCRSERVAKYNRLLRIEEELGDTVPYAGFSSFPRLAPAGPGES